MVSEGPQNPFEQPATETAPVRDSSRRVVIIGVFAIFALQFAVRNASRALLIRTFSQGDTAALGTQMTLLFLTSQVGTIAGGLLASAIPPRRAVSIAAAIVAFGQLCLALEPSMPLAYVSAFGYGVFAAPLYLILGREVLGAPELRDACFTLLTPAIALAGGAASAVPLMLMAVSDTIVFFATTALALAIIPVALSMLREQAPRPAETPPALSSSIRMALGFALALDAITALAATRRISAPSDAMWLAVISSGAPFLVGVGAAVFYLARHVPGARDAAFSKIALGGAFAALAALAGASSETYTCQAGTVLAQIASVLITPIALGAAATLPKPRSALFAIVVWVVGSGVLGTIAQQASMALGSVIYGIAAAVALVLSIALFISSRRAREKTTLP